MTVLYLLRHEEAEPAAFGPDGHRALTRKGRQRMRTTGRRLAELGEAPDLILTSPLVRAVQTAEILATAIDFDGPLLAQNRIAEPASFADLLQLIDEHPGRRIVMVGHEPTLSSFLSHLLGTNKIPRGFTPGTLMSLERGAPWRLRFVLWPDETGVAKSL